jgi:hypothetical protein
MDSANSRLLLFEASLLEFLENSQTIKSFQVQSVSHGLCWEAVEFSFEIGRVEVVATE